MSVNTEEFRKITGYIRDELLKQENTAYGYINSNIVKGMTEWCTLDGYLKATGEKKTRNKPQVADDLFEEWWKVYPASANFTYKGMTFRATRSLRSNKEVCARLYQATIASGITHETMLNALNTQVNLMKQESYEKGMNQLQYMSAAEPYLRQRKWEAFAEIEDETTSSDEYNNCG